MPRVSRGRLVNSYSPNNLAGAKNSGSIKPSPPKANLLSVLKKVEARRFKLPSKKSARPGWIGRTIVGYASANVGRIANGVTNRGAVKEPRGSVGSGRPKH